MNAVAALAAATVALVGCQGSLLRPSPARVISVGEPFVASIAAEAMRPGKAIVTGSALVRQRGGTVVSCAGGEVRLIPATAYAAERIAAFYGPGDRAAAQLVRQGDIRVDPDPPDYHTHTRITRCDAQGNFEFASIAGGTYFVVTVIAWQVQPHSTEGAALMHRVTVAEGQRARIILAP